MLKQDSSDSCVIAAALACRPNQIEPVLHHHLPQNGRCRRPTRPHRVDPHCHGRRCEPTAVHRARSATSPRASAELKLRSAAALVIELGDGQLLYAKNTDAVMPIASITKLMTAMVVLDSGLPLEEPITIEAADVDTLKGTRSRLKVGMTLTRRELLKLALMASENRAAAALARSYPGGMQAFIPAMNQKAQ